MIIGKWRYVLRGRRLKRAPRIKQGMPSGRERLAVAAAGVERALGPPTQAFVVIASRGNGVPQAARSVKNVLVARPPRQQLGLPRPAAACRHGVFRCIVGTASALAGVRFSGNRGSWLWSLSVRGVGHRSRRAGITRKWTWHRGGSGMRVSDNAVENETTVPSECAAEGLGRDGRDASSVLAVSVVRCRVTAASCLAGTMEEHAPRAPRLPAPDAARLSRPYGLGAAANRVDGRRTVATPVTGKRERDSSSPGTTRVRWR